MTGETGAYKYMAPEVRLGSDAQRGPSPAAAQRLGQSLSPAPPLAIYLRAGAPSAAEQQVITCTTQPNPTQVFRYERYSMKCDIFSMSIILYEMFEGIIAVRQQAPPGRAPALRRARMSAPRPPIRQVPDHGAKQRATDVAHNGFRPKFDYLSVLGSSRALAVVGLIQECW